MKIANIDREILHNFWTTWGISIKFSGKMCLMIILKVTKNQGFTLSLEDTFFKKPHGGVKLTPHPPPPRPFLRRFRLKALWDDQGKIKMFYGMSRVKKQLSGKRSIQKFRFRNLELFKQVTALVNLFSKHQAT